MATIELTTDTFDETVGKDGIVLVDFWADWCGPCKRFAPIFEQSSEAKTEIVHAKVDTEAHQELSVRFGVTAIPTLMAFRDGVMVFNPEGKPIGFIRLPERCANLCFGGPKNNRLYMASSHSLYALYVEAHGAV